jgi:diguanylate cyclase (GGDEF)-like protein
MSDFAAGDQLGLVDQAVRERVARLLAENESLRARVEELERLADTDPLTGLPNRRAFMRELDRAIARVGRYQSTIALMYVDLDNLKSANDAHGHAAGDAVLNHVAGLLRSALRAGDFVARIGGDEFALLVEPVDAASAEAKARTLSGAAKSSQLIWNRKVVSIGVSIGVTMIDADDTAQALLGRADAAMYAAKGDQRSDR